MPNQNLPTDLESILATNNNPDAVFSALVPGIAQILQCDRCFLYLRNPHTCVGKIIYCWVRSHKYPDITDLEWKREPESLVEEDPLFAAAVRTEASVFVEDVETASPEVLNRAFEQKYFGHRALIHAHLCDNGELWGILQPCVFGEPRVWTEFDHSIVTQVEKRIAPLAAAYVKEAGI